MANQLRYCKAQHRIISKSDAEISLAAADLLEHLEQRKRGTVIVMVVGASI
jgi:hypothetical protein